MPKNTRKNRTKKLKTTNSIQNRQTKTTVQEVSRVSQESTIVSPTSSSIPVKKSPNNKPVTVLEEIEKRNRFIKKELLTSLIISVGCFAVLIILKLLLS
jgi:hypothetical protein